jgi:hypothetical protein
VSEIGSPPPENPQEPIDTAAALGSASEGAAPLVSTATSDAADSTLSPGKPAARVTARFAFLYGVLGAVLVAAIAGFVILVVKPATGSSVPWSTWKPPEGTTAAMTAAIAQHVASQYRLNKSGSPLVAVVAGPPQVTSGTHKVSISHLAVKPSANSAKGIQVVGSGKTWTDQFCGLGAACSISSGQATVPRGRLVRREALEVALYTFKFVPAIDSIVAFMPPPPGETSSTLLYLQKSDFKSELSQPLSKTLPLATPPLPSVPDPRESSTIDKLTLPNFYSYSLQALQDNSALLVMSPFPASQ